MPGVLRDRRLGIGRSVIDRLHPDTRSYRDRLLANNGTISPKDLNGVDAFVRAIYAANLRDSVGSSHKIIDCSPMAGDNLAAMQVKLWYPDGVADKLTLVNIVAGDYSRTTGLKGDGTTKYVDTHLNPTTAGLTNTDAGLVVYLRDAGNNSSQIGQGSSTNFFVAQNFNGSTFYSGAAGFVDTTTQGLYSCNSNSFYRNGVQVNSAAITATLLNSTIFLLARNNSSTNTKVPFQYTNRNIGFACVTRNKTAQNEADLYTAVQALMTASGRAV